jgi:hypothetical protein
MKNGGGWRRKFEDPIELPDGRTLASTASSTVATTADPTLKKSVPTPCVPMALGRFISYGARPTEGQEYRVRTDL